MIKLNRFSPHAIVGTVIFLCCVMTTLSFLLVSQQVFSGIKLQLKNGQLIVDEVLDTDLSANIKEGEVITAVWINSSRYKLESYSVIDPKAISSFHEYNDFLSYLSRFRYDKGEKIYLEKLNKEKVTLNAIIGVPFKFIPVIFWYMLIVNIGCLFISLIVWLLKPYRIESGFLLLATLGHYGLFTADSVFLSRDLFVESADMRWVIGFQVITMHIFAFSMFALQASYPLRLLSKKNLLLIMLLHILLLLNYFLQRIALPHVFFMQFIPGFFVAMVFTAVQWYKSKLNAVNRTAILVTQLSVIFPSLVLIFLYAFPLIMKSEPLISEKIVIVMPLFLFVGWSVAILKYRLFEIEVWWLKILRAILIFILFIGLDAFFAHLLQVTKFFSFSLSAVFLLGVYFLLRQILFNKLYGIDHSTNDPFACICNTLSDSLPTNNIDNLARIVVVEYFKPLHVLEREDICHSIGILQDGLHLQLPYLSANKHFIIVGKHKGRKIFGKSDIEVAQAFWLILEVVNTASEDHIQILLTERQRIMRDLHDTLGAKLLTLSRILSDPHQRIAMRESLWCLRQLISLEVATDLPTIEDFLGNLRFELAELCEEYEITLVWQVTLNPSVINVEKQQLIKILATFSDALHVVLQKGVIHCLTIKIDIVTFNVINICYFCD